MPVSMLLHASRALRLAAALTLLFFLVLVLFWRSMITLPQRSSIEPHRLPQRQVLRDWSNAKDTATTHPRVPCTGARGVLLDSSNVVDVPRPTQRDLGRDYPEPTFGSYDALGLSKGWMTFEQRYGPYGYEKNSSSEARRASPSVDWNSVDWGALVDECAKANDARFRLPKMISQRLPRFRLFDDDDVKLHQEEETEVPQHETGRQAIILRTWSTYEYYPEDLWNLRSIITEASLATHGDYQVFLLVDLKCGEACQDVFTNATMHQEILEKSVPKEFWNVAVLVHENLQRSWYAKVEETRSMWQIMQPLQLFAHFYPEFDHYWQLEMDARFTGHVGNMLQAFDLFGREQPYKQARERASWAYMSSQHGTYSEFSSAINSSLNGNATIWGPDRIKHVEPLLLPNNKSKNDPLPSTPLQDNFTHALHRPADLLLLTQLNDVRLFERHSDWVFAEWYLGGFTPHIPRYMSVPAQARASYSLLEAIHRSQHEQGLRVASEATLPSWALWLGLKIVGLPIPRFQFPEREAHELGWVLNGGLPGEKGRFEDGIARGDGVYRGSSLGFFLRPLTFDWWSSLCDPMWEWWMMEGEEGEDGEREREEEEKKKDGNHPEYVVVPKKELPGFMHMVNGEVYMPEMLLHPRKSNLYHAPG